MTDTPTTNSTTPNVLASGTTVTATPGVTAIPLSSPGAPNTVSAVLIGAVAEVPPNLQGKALIASKTPWGVLASYAVGFLAARYGLGLDDASTQVVAGGAVLAGSYAMRYITSSPITGLLSRL